MTTAHYNLLHIYLEKLELLSTAVQCGGSGRISPPDEVRRLRRAAHRYLAEHPARLPQSLRSAPDFLVWDRGRFQLWHVRGSTRSDVI